jgi:hypothetical protein
VPGLRQRCLGLSRVLLAGRESAIIHDPAPRQASAGRWLHRASQENSYHLYRKFYHRTKCGDHVGFPRLPAGAVRNVPVRPEHKRGRGPPDVEPAHQVQPGLGVDVDVAHAVDHPGHIAEYPPGGPAGRAERRGELHERRSLAERPANIGAGEDLAGNLGFVTKGGNGDPASPVGCRWLGFLFGPWRLERAVSAPRPARRSRPHRGLRRGTEHPVAALPPKADAAGDGKRHDRDN